MNVGACELEKDQEDLHTEGEDPQDLYMEGDASYKVRDSTEDNSSEELRDSTEVVTDEEGSEEKSSKQSQNWWEWDWKHILFFIFF